ncbi:MAG: cyclic lactone autoinducer peptide [Oscillospiraceae bacterium]|jgi:cyclic lactone autoinducer peptide|nr:cyclic lactone autoinducer peptide [Oscillospiraceae bacterium]
MTKQFLAKLARAGSAAALRTASVSASVASGLYLYQPKTPRRLAQRAAALKK